MRKVSEILKKTAISADKGEILGEITGVLCGKDLKTVDYFMLDCLSGAISLCKFLPPRFIRSINDDSVLVSNKLCIKNADEIDVTKYSDISLVLPVYDADGKKLGTLNDIFFGDSKKAVESILVGKALYPPFVSSAEQDGVVLNLSGSARRRSAPRKIEKTVDVPVLALNDDSEKKELGGDIPADNGGTAFFEERSVFEESVVIKESAPAEEPVVTEKPIADNEPIADEITAEDKTPAVSEEPVAVVESVVSEESVTVVESVVSEKPVTVVESVAVDESIVNEDPSIKEPPAVTADTVINEISAVSDDTVINDQTAAYDEPAAIEEPDIIEETAACEESPVNAETVDRGENALAETVPSPSPVSIAEARQKMQINKYMPHRVIGNYRFLLGRVVTKNIYDYSHHLIIKRGALVTADTVKSAHQNNKLIELTLCSKA